MIKLKEIPLLKLAIIAILITALFILRDISKNGRYKGYGEDMVIDTRTGNVFMKEYIDGYNYFKPNIHWSLEE